MEEKKFENLINDLKNLRKINAPDNFEFNLQTRINNLSEKEPEIVKKKYRLVTTIAFASVVVILFIISRPFAEDYEDPFQIQPQLREDLIAISENSNALPLNDIINDSFKESDSNLQKGIASSKSNLPEKLNDINSSSADNQVQFTISKKDLNFTRPVMNDEEIRQVQILKQKLMSKKN
jgi:hypothetical protein